MENYVAIRYNNVHNENQYDAGEKKDTITANDHSVPAYDGGICHPKNGNLNVYYGGN